MNNGLALTKSDYQLFLEAPLHLWAHKHDLIHKTPTEFEIHLMNQGYEVEGFARNFLGKYVVNASEGESILFQETFSDMQFTARTDALIFKPRFNTCDLYEIKSSSSNKPEFIIDAAFQYLIVNKHITIDRIFILHLNKEYVRYSHLNLEHLFIAEDITEKVHESILEIDIKRGEALEVAAAGLSEGIQHCYKPNECPCPQICHLDLPDYSIYDIPRITKKKKMGFTQKSGHD